MTESEIKRPPAHLTVSITGPYYLAFRLQGLPRTLNSRGHWRVGHNAGVKWKQDVALAVEKKWRPAKPLERARLMLARHSSVPMDHDNLVSGFKPVIDGLVECGILADDKWKNIGMPDYAWYPAPKGRGFITIEVREIKEE